MGTTEVRVLYEGQTPQLQLVVVKGKGPTLMGRDWLSKIRLDWSKIYYTWSAGLESVLSEFKEVFQEELGTFKGFEAKIEVDPNATPRYCKARTVPYAMRQRVEEELNRLVAEGTLEPVEYSEWAARIVAMLKSDRKSVCI